MLQPIPAISIDGLGKTCGDTVVLHPTTLDIPLGEVFALVGQDAVARSTVIRLLAAHLAPSTGTARVAGHDIVTEPLQVRRVIGYLPESARLCDDLTALENLVHFARMSGVEHPGGAAHAALNFLDIADLAARRVRTLPREMRQHVGLARAILHNPHVLFLDEPTTGFGPEGLCRLHESIGLLQQIGMTVVISTSDLSEVAHSCTAAGVLVRGRLALHDSVNAIAAQDALRNLDNLCSGSGRINGKF